MIKMLLCLLAGASMASTAQSYRPMGLGFGAPTVNDYANNINPSPGEIVYDTSRLGFYGNAANPAAPTVPNWVALTTTAPTPTIQIFTASGTYTKPAGVRFIKVTVVGAGGGGGGTSSATSSSGCGGGGAGGGTAIKWITSPVGPYTVTIGSGGTGGGAGNNPGTDGGDSIFAYTTNIVGAGGAGGAGSGPNIGPVFGANAGKAELGTGGDINLRGSDGGMSLCLNGTTQANGGAGGASFFSGSVQAPLNLSGPGFDGYGPGGGGSGATQVNNGGAKAGGSGQNGMVIVEEFY